MGAGAEAAVGYRTRGIRRRRYCKPGAMIDGAGKGALRAWCGMRGCAVRCRMCAV